MGTQGCVQGASPVSSLLQRSYDGFMVWDWIESCSIALAQEVT